MKEMLIILAASLLLIAAALLIPTGKEIKTERTFTILDANLSPLATVTTLPEEFNGLVIVGKTKKGYVYVERKEVFRPIFVDRTAFLAGRMGEISIPYQWWMEKNGVRIDPVKGRAYTGAEIVVKTPYEIVRTKEQVIPLYQPIYLGKEAEANDSCIVVKWFNGVRVPVLLEGEGLVDPDAVTVCRRCKDFVTIRVFDRNGNPLDGYFSEGDLREYRFFGKFRGEFNVCKCNRIKIYSSGYRPVSLSACEDRNVTLDRMDGDISRIGGFIVIDSTGALVSEGGKTTVPKGIYRLFTRFPLREKGISVPIIDLNHPVWVGYKKYGMVPVYSIVRDGNRYLYALSDGLHPLDGVLWREGITMEYGGKTIVAFGDCVSLWTGSDLLSGCPGLGVTIIKEASLTK